MIQNYEDAQGANHIDKSNPKIKKDISTCLKRFVKNHYLFLLKNLFDI